MVTRNLDLRIGRHIVDRMSDQITDAVRTAIAHDVTPQEFVEMVQEAWGLELHDKQKHDAETFNALLHKGVNI